ncbi:hypothetical protein BDW42DRAFT_135961 [Aspergillus taichungensis]|uniref:Uncharacterized protein n=1 Tax=Aspergillus taichungensis TaxID=482145 RepID=A0A2J5HP85_9EURO|nr:hypothetical protein BDW42DRAFT_135961 [Aspergillus taichungensis]
MTSTPSVAFPAMEVPALDDSMEMASPYQGHADDFDIDIDIMEDQASNADRDMTAVDDYIESIDGTDYNQEGSKDADMIDDAESVMVDAEDHYQEDDYNMEMKDEEKSYEADMLEDDYDEDIDAPVTDQQEEPAPPVQPEHDQHPAPPTVTDVDIEETEKPAETTQPEITVEHVDEPSVEVNQRQEQASDSKELGSAAQGVDAPGSWHAEETRDGTNPDSQEGPQEAWRGDSTDHVAGTKDPQNADSTAAEGSSLVKNNEEQGVVQENEEEEKASVPKEIEAQNEQEAAPQPDTTGDSSLYPIKVYYQDNEISLFPPREGDTSETFFLEDESLAHGPFAKLFESCREVLHDHIGDNEVLVMDVDALNLQLNEVCLPF